MTFDPTKPVRTRDGRKARIVAADYKSHGRETIIALITRENGNEFTEYYEQDGNLFGQLGTATPLSLVNIPERKERFIKIPTPSNAYEAWTRLHDTMEEASDQKGWVPTSGLLKLVFEGDDLVDVEILEKR